MLSKNVTICTNLEFAAVLALPGPTCPTCKEVQLESESDSSGAEAEELKRVEVSWTEPPPELHPRTDDATGVLVWTSVDGLNLRVDEPQNKEWSYSLGNRNISHYIRT